MRGRLRAAGIAGDGVGDARDMLEDALHTPETPPRNHRGFGRLAGRLLVHGRRRHIARLFGRRSSDEESGRGEEPDENERRKRRASFEGRDHGPTPYLPTANHRNALRISRHYGVDATLPVISRTRVIKLARALALLVTTLAKALCYRRKPLTKGKRVSLHVGIKKLDCECAVHDRPALTDELVETVVDHHALAVGVDVGAMAFARLCAVDHHPAAHRL